MLAAIFFASRRLDSQRSGSGIRIKKISVTTFEENVVQMIGFDTAAWHTSVEQDV
jgi:hypothetical protein